MKLDILKKQNLLEEGMTSVDAEHSLDSSENRDLPWIAKLLLGAGGWITAIFLAGFTALLMSKLFGSSEEEVAAVFGFIYLGISIFVSRISSHPFLSQLTLAIGTAGLVLIIIGLWRVGDPRGQISFITTALVCPAIYYFSKNGIQKYISVVSVFLVWWIFQISNRHEMSSSLAPILGTIVTGLLLSGLVKTRYWRPALLGVVSGLYFLLYLPLFPDRYVNSWQVYDTIVLSAVIALGFGLVIWRLTNPESRQSIVLLILFAALLFLISCFGSAGIAASLGVIVSAQARNDKTLKWLGILALAVFVIAFYYFLGKPLLSKSYLLLGTGASLLIATASIHFFTKQIDPQP